MVAQGNWKLVLYHLKYDLVVDVVERRHVHRPIGAIVSGFRQWTIALESASLVPHCLCDLCSGVTPGLQPLLGTSEGEDEGFHRYMKAKVATSGTSERCNQFWSKWPLKIIRYGATHQVFIGHNHGAWRNYKPPALSRATLL